MAMVQSVRPVACSKERPAGGAATHVWLVCASPATCCMLGRSCVLQCWCTLDLAAYFTEGSSAAATAGAAEAAAPAAAGQSPAEVAAASQPGAQRSGEPQQGQQHGEQQQPPAVLLSSGAASSESSELQLSASEEQEMQLSGPLARVLSGPHFDHLEPLAPIPMERHPSLMGEEQKRELTQHAQQVQQAVQQAQQVVLHTEQAQQHAAAAEQQAAAPPASPAPRPLPHSASSRLSRRSLPRAGGGEVLQDVWLPLVDPGNASKVCGRVRVSVRATSIELLEQQLWRRLLPIMDLNGDGLLTRDEFGSLLEVRLWLDGKGDCEMFMRHVGRGAGNWRFVLFHWLTCAWRREAVRSRLPGVLCVHGCSPHSKCLVVSRAELSASTHLPPHSCRLSALI